MRTAIVDRAARLALVAIVCATWWAALSGASNQTAITTCNDPATCRTALGLGTASTLDVGTGNNNVVQLNASAQLPAVSAVNLTNIPAPTYTPGDSASWLGTDPTSFTAASDRLAAVVRNVPQSLSAPSVAGTLVYYFLPHTTGLGYQTQTAWPDAAGGGITGTASTAVEPTASLGQVAHVRISTNSINLGTSMGRPANWTMAVLFQLDDLSGLEGVFVSAPSSGASASSAGFMVADGGAIYYTFGNGTNYSDGSTSYTLTARKWHVVVVRYTAGDTDCDVWVDGVSRAVTPASTAASSSTGGTAYQFHLGQMGERTAAWRMTGRIAAGLLYSTALSNDDVGVLSTHVMALGGVQ